MTTLGSAAGVIATIRDDASAEMERIEHDADAAIAAMAEAGSVLPAPERQQEVESARRTILAAEGQERWDEARVALTDREAWMTEVMTEGLGALADTSDAPAVREWMTTLVREALPHIPGAPVVVSAPPACERVLDDEWRAQLEQQTSRSLTLTFDGPAAGCIVRSADGQVTFDNSADARSRRTIAEWRRLLARLYMEAVTSEPATAAAPPSPVGAP